MWRVFFMRRYIRAVIEQIEQPLVKGLNRKKRTPRLPVAGSVEPVEIERSLFRWSLNSWRL